MRPVWFLAACAALIGVATADKKIVCYFGSWAVYRPGNGKFDISYIDPSLCTHLIYTFVGLRGDHVQVLDPWQDLPDNWGKDGFGRFNALREKNPSLKTIIAIGGWNEGSTKYSKMASHAASRERFADNVVRFVKKWNFDGFDLDWEYPAQRGGSPQDVENYIKLLRTLRSRFDREGLILTAAVAAAGVSASKSYNIAEVSRYLDIINLMAYDLHGAWETHTGINAPLRAAPSDTEQNKALTVEASVEYWLNNGASRDKLVVGIPLYGRGFTLANANENGVGAPTRGAGHAGPYTRTPGTLGYNEICQFHKSGGWTVVFDEERRVPYTFRGDQWIGYDNVRSVREKAEYIAKLNLTGAMVWSIETDDFNGICGERYPLLKTLNAVLRSGSPIPEESLPPAAPTPRTTANPSPTTQGPDGGRSDISAPPRSDVNAPPRPDVNAPPRPGQCTGAGNIPDPDSCGFIACVPNMAGSYETYYFQCGPKTCYNPDTGNCDWPQS